MKVQTGKTELLSVDAAEWQWGDARQLGGGYSFPAAAGSWFQSEENLSAAWSVLYAVAGMKVGV